MHTLKITIDAGGKFTVSCPENVRGAHAAWMLLKPEARERIGRGEPWTMVAALDLAAVLEANIFSLGFDRIQLCVDDQRAEMDLSERCGGDTHDVAPRSGRFEAWLSATGLTPTPEQRALMLAAWEAARRDALLAMVDAVRS